LRSLLGLARQTDLPGVHFMVERAGAISTPGTDFPDKMAEESFSRSASPEESASPGAANSTMTVSQTFASLPREVNDRFAQAVRQHPQRYQGRIERAES
jgi:hypothetical protein